VPRPDGGAMEANLVRLPSLLGNNGRRGRGSRFFAR